MRSPFGRVRAMIAVCIGLALVALTIRGITGAPPYIALAFVSVLLLGIFVGQWLIGMPDRVEYLAGKRVDEHFVVLAWALNTTLIEIGERGGKPTMVKIAREPDEDGKTWLRLTVEFTSLGDAGRVVIAAKDLQYTCSEYRDVIRSEVQRGFDEIPASSW